MINAIFKKSFVLALVSIFLSMSFQSTAWAGLIDTNQIAVDAQVQVQKDEINDFFANEELRASLKDYGAEVAELDQRMANMTDAEISQLHEQIESLPAGSGVLGAVLTVILILVLLDILGATDVFPNI